MGILIILVSGCEEAQRFKITGDDSIPPGPPTFIDSKPLHGGARIFFMPPADEDVLYVEASYTGAAGKKLRFSASYFTDSLDVYGFGRAGDHEVELCAVDQAGNRSTSRNVTVTSLEPLAALVAKSVQTLPSFAAMMLKWSNEAKEPIYVLVNGYYSQNDVPHDFTTVFTTSQTETRSIDSLKLYAGEPLAVQVSVLDKYGNMFAAKDTSIVLLTDEVIDKDEWTLPPTAGWMNGITQVDGLNPEAAIDGVIDILSQNYFITTQANPWNMIIDLGENYELSRIVTHQRWSGYETPFGVIDRQGNLYRAGNVLTYNLYGWDANAYTWEFLLRREIFQPVVTIAEDYTTLGIAGDMSFIYPEEPQFSMPTRYLRFEAVNGTYISEITLYGRKAQ